MLKDTEIPEVKLVIPDTFTDNRGNFSEMLNLEKFKNEVSNTTFVQMNQSTSRKGVIRGIHYQIAYSQGKLVQCINGSLYDVAVDLRRGSPTFGKWIGQVLISYGNSQLWIPKNFGHAFLALEDNTRIMYFVTEEHKAKYERCIVWDDPKLNINWEEIIKKYNIMDIIVSDKDKNGEAFENAEVFSYWG